MDYVWLLLTPLTVVWGIVSSFIFGQGRPSEGNQGRKRQANEPSTSGARYVNQSFLARKLNITIFLTFSVLQRRNPESVQMATLLDFQATMMTMKPTLTTAIPHNKCNQSSFKNKIRFQFANFLIFLSNRCKTKPFSLPVLLHENSDGFLF